MSLREKPDSFDGSTAHPLLGTRVLNTRAVEDGEELSRMLRDLGAAVIAMPATRITLPDDPAPLDAAIAAIAAGSPGYPAFEWIAFTSAHAVSAFLDRLLGCEAPGGAVGAGGEGSAPRRWDLRVLAGIKLAAVGPATAAALARYGLVADLIPDRAAGRHLAAAFADVSGLRILLPRSDIALRDLPDALRARGATVTEVVSYATRPAPPDPLLLQSVLSGEIDAATFFSPSAIDGLAAQVAPRSLADVLGGVASVCVGETTAQAARSKGLAEILVAEAATTSGVVETLVRWRRKQQGGQNEPPSTEPAS